MPLKYAALRPARGADIISVPPSIRPLQNIRRQYHRLATSPPWLFHDTIPGTVRTWLSPDIAHCSLSSLSQLEVPPVLIAEHLPPLRPLQVADTDVQPAAPA